MIKSMKILASLVLGTVFALPYNADASAEKKNEPTTRSDAVIFKIHDIEPVSKDGIVTGCDFTTTLYNRTAVNFRNFTINLKWNDVVDERFKFDKYAEAVMSKEDFKKIEKTLADDDKKTSNVETSITVNAFGSDKQISLRSHIDNEKCYLLLNKADFTVTPCDIARTIEDKKGGEISAGQKECTGLFQFVSTSNPEYFGKFKRISQTEEAIQNEIVETQELSDIDSVIGKIVENLGISDSTLTNVN